MKKTAKTATNFLRGDLGVEFKRHSFRGNQPQNISCVSRGWNTPEPAVSQVPIRHNRSLRSLLFRLGLDSRQNLMWKRLLPVLKEKMYWIHFSFQNLLNQPEIRDILTSEVSL